MACSIGSPPRVNNTVSFSTGSDSPVRAASFTMRSLASSTAVGRYHVSAVKHYVSNDYTRQRDFVLKLSLSPAAFGMIAGAVKLSSAPQPHHRSCQS